MRRKESPVIRETEIERILIGYKIILGTKWPVTSQVRRVQEGKAVRWVLTVALCNGVPAGSKSYRTKREALAALHSKTLNRDTYAVCLSLGGRQELFETTLPAGSTYILQGERVDGLGQRWQRILVEGYLYEIEAA